MKTDGNIGRQLSDLLGYILLPLFCFLLPVSWGDALIGKCAREGWILRARSRAARKTAEQFLFIADRGGWQQRWRLVELSEARDVWFCILGRTRGLVANIGLIGQMPEAGGRLVMIGLHWGPSVLALHMFRKAGLKPRFVYRPVGPELRRRAPLQFFYLSMLVSYIERVCDGEAIRVPGATARIDEMMSAGATPVLLMDAPPTGGRNTVRTRLMGRRALLGIGGLELLVKHRANCVFYALGLPDRGRRKSLDLSEPVEAKQIGQLATAVAGHFNQFMMQDSAQWRLWHAAGQLFVEDPA